MTRRGWTVLTGAVVMLLLTAVAAHLPVPYVALGPGPTVDTLGSANGEEVVTIRGRATSASRGHLNLTTVSVTDGLDLASAVRFWFDDSTAVIPRDVVFQPDLSQRQIDQQNEQAFAASQTSAETAALRELGYPVAVTVVSQPKNSPSSGKIAVGDVLNSVDGAAVTSKERLIEVVQEKAVGDPVSVGLDRKGRRLTVPITLGRADDGRPILGVTVENRQPHPFQITINLAQVGGPSAGLMFALAIIDKVESQDLTGGLFIAGTGEIDEDGDVGPIGGIRQKMIAARRAGASVFLVPEGNCAEASPDAPRGLRLIKVSSLKGALGALMMLREKKGTPATCSR
jgi:PDZ domain-containing protein